MRRAIAIAVACVVALLLPAVSAAAKSIDSKVKADVVGVIDRQATVSYYFTGQITTAGLNFPCLEDRHVVLIRVEQGGHEKRIVSADTNFFGHFTVSLERRLTAIPGHYYAKVKPAVKHLHKRRGRAAQQLNCSGARTSAFLVQLPPGLAEAPVVQGV